MAPPFCLIERLTGAKAVVSLEEQINHCTESRRSRSCTALDLKRQFTVHYSLESKHGNSMGQIDG